MIALVQHAAGGSASGGGASGTVTLGDTTGASLIVMVTADFGSSTNGDTVSDNYGNTYSHLTNIAGGSTNTGIWYCANPSVGAGHTVTVAGAYVGFAASAWSGVATVSPKDQENGADAGGTFTTAHPGSITPGFAGELIFAALGHRSAGSVSASLTLLDDKAFVGAVSMAVAVAYEVQTTATARDCTFTLSLNSTDGSTIIASFKAAAGGGSGPVARTLTVNQAPNRAGTY